MYKNKFHRFRVEWFYTGFFAFLTVCLILLVLFTSVIISHAEESSGFVSSDDFINVDSIESSYPDVDFSDYNFPYDQGYSDTYSNITSISIPSFTPDDIPDVRYNYSENDNDYDVDISFNTSIPLSITNDVPYIVYYDVRYNQYYVVAYFSGFEFLMGETSGYECGDTYIVGNTVILPNNTIKLTCYVDVDDLDTETVRDSYYNWSQSGKHVFFSNHQGAVYDFCEDQMEMLATNIQIRAVRISDITNDFGVSSTPSNFFGSNHGWSDAMSDAFVHYDNMAVNGDSIIDVHAGTSSGDNTYPDGSGGDDTNNMYMRTADWQFNIPKYWGNVTSTLVKPEYTTNWGKGNITFYGLLNDYQEANADHFNLVFNFYVLFQGHRFSDTQQDVNQNFSKSFALRSVTVPLSDFISSNNSYNFDVSDIFNRAMSNDNVNVNDYIQPFKTANSIDKWKWTISCDAQLTAGNYVSGSIQETYNFISQVSKEDSNTITENHNPYHPDPDNPDVDDDDSDDDDDYSGKGIHLHNNNYDNDSLVINNGPSDGLVNDLTDKLIPDSSGNGGLTNEFVELTNSNQWFTVMSSALPWLGVDFWHAVQVVWITMLGIIGVGLFIWIIIHIL